MKKGKYLDKVIDIIEDDVLVPARCSNSVTVDYKVKKSGAMIVKLDSDDGLLKARYPANVAHALHESNMGSVRESAARIINAARADAEEYASGALRRAVEENDALETQRLPAPEDNDLDYLDNLLIGGHFKNLDENYYENDDVEEDFEL